MMFDSIEGFLAMGGHGLYVWSTYLMALLVITGNCVAPVLTRRREIARQRAAQLQEQVR